MDNKNSQSFWQRLTGGLKRTSSALGGAITDLVSKRKLGTETIDDLEDILIRADLGVDVAARITDAIGADRYEKGISAD
ncbi:MAG: signal recognition particle receptor subunit alpha, partial [Xanthobacteraceae bacterium]